MLLIDCFGFIGEPSEEYHMGTSEEKQNIKQKYLSLNIVLRKVKSSYWCQSCKTNDQIQFIDDVDIVTLIMVWLFEYIIF